MKRALSCVLAASLGFMGLLAGCGSSGSEKVRIGEVTRSLFYAPQYVAIEKGFFKEEGLEVELTTTWGGDKTMTALLSDGIDVALVGSETSIYVEQQGSTDPVINFAQLTQTDGTFLVSRKKVENFSWEQLKGSVFLGQRKGGMPQMAGEFTLKKHNIDPQKDLQLIQNIDYANISSAFASGTGEYVQLFEPTASQYEKDGIGYVVASFGTESGKLPYTVFMSKKSYIDKNQETIQKFTNAIYKAQKWVASQPPEETAKIIAPYFKEIQPDILTSSVKRYLEQGSYAADPILDEAEWNNLQDIMDEAGELKQRADYAKLVNTTFAQKAKEGR